MTDSSNPTTSVDDSDEGSAAAALRSALPGWSRSPESIVTAILVGSATLFVLWNLRVGLWFDDTTPTGEASRIA